MAQFKGSAMTLSWPSDFAAEISAFMPPIAAADVAVAAALVDLFDEAPQALTAVSVASSVPTSTRLRVCFCMFELRPLMCLWLITEIVGGDISASQGENAISARCYRHLRRRLASD